MRLVFLGSPEAVLAPLELLVHQAKAWGHELVGVVSQPARPVGRGQNLVDPPVAAFAKAQGIPVLQPEKASAPDFLEAFAALKPDVAITAAYGQILSDAFLKVPARATINLHPSLLPKYRGAIPIPAALLDGETTSGVTILFTVKKLDAGNIIVQEKTPVGPQETTGELTARYFALAAQMLEPALKRLEDPAFIGVPQDEKKVTHCKKLEKQDGQIDWEQSAEDSFNRFRAFSPWPGSFTFLAGKRLAITEMDLDTLGFSALDPGQAVFDKKFQCLMVGTSHGALRILKLKPAGGKEQQAAAFWNGLKDRSHVVFTKEGG